MINYIGRHTICRDDDDDVKQILIIINILIMIILIALITIIIMKIIILLHISLTFRTTLWEGAAEGGAEPAAGAHQ